MFGISRPTLYKTIENLSNRFHNDMIQTYLAAKRLKYNASYFVSFKRPLYL